QVLGFSGYIIEYVLTMVLILAIVIGLQAVGVVLMSTLLIAPAAAARQWTRHIHSMIIIAGLCGGISAGVGVYMSTIIDHLPTGPAIVVVASCIAVASLI